MLILKKEALSKFKGRIRAFDFPEIEPKEATVSAYVETVEVSREGLVTILESSYSLGVMDPSSPLWGRPIIMRYQRIAPVRKT